MAKRYLDVAYKDRDFAKRLGARWDPSVKRWYCPAGSDLARIFTWRQAPVTTKVDPHVQLASMRRQRISKPPMPQSTQNFELSLFS